MSGPWKASELRNTALREDVDALVAGGVPTVDDVTVEVSGGNLQVKDDGIGAEKIGAGEVNYEHHKVTDKASFHVPLGEVRGSTGLVTTATPADSVWAFLIATNVVGLTSNLADGGTKTATGTFQFMLPENYVPAGDVVVRVTVQLKSVTGTGVANNGSDIDILAYEQDKTAGTVGADICATAAQTFAALDTVYVKTFTITATDLVAGDVVNFNIVGRAIENDGGNGTLQVVVHNIEIGCDVYGAAA